MSTCNVFCVCVCLCVYVCVCVCVCVRAVPVVSYLYPVSLSSLRLLVGQD